MKIGLIDVDGHVNVKSQTGKSKLYPNLALMKISAYHKEHGDEVGWYNTFEEYDLVYMSKVFSFTPDYQYPINNAKQIKKGGSGYKMFEELPCEIEHAVPDYDLYNVPSDTAYGFLTRGCPNKCKWCLVPKKEGAVHPHADIEEIAVNGRNKIILMDNNVLACQHGIEQLKKIASMSIKVDFNQGLDARLVTPEIADLLASVKWIKNIRFGCDTPKQVEECDKVTDMLVERGYKGLFLFYTMIYGDINECYERLSFWRNKGNRYNVQAQPYIELDAKVQNPPQWQKDMAHWANQKIAFHAVDFKEFYPRKGFKCSQYF